MEANYKAITNCLNDNQVNIQNSYFYDYTRICGAFVEDESLSVLMQGNKVTIRDAVVDEGEIFGAFYNDKNYSYADDVSMSNNEVTLLGGRFGRNLPHVRGGSVTICAAASPMYSASITNNKLTIRGTRDTLDLKYADLIGSFNPSSADVHLPNASSNQLVVDTEDVLARSVHLFDDIKFVLTNERINRLGSNTPMLNIVEALDLNSGDEYSVTISFDIRGLNIATLDLQEGDYITLIKSSTGIYGPEKKIIQLGSGMPNCTLKVVDLNKLTLVVGEERSLKDRFIFQYAPYFDHDLAYVNPSYLEANKTYTIARPIELFTDAYPGARMMVVAYNDQRQVTGNTLEFRTISTNFGGFLENIMIGGGIAENYEASGNTLKIIDAALHFLLTDPDDPILETIADRSRILDILFNKLGIMPGSLGCLVGGCGSNGSVTNNAVVIGADSFGLRQPEISGVATIIGGFSRERYSPQTSNINVSGNSAEINNGVFEDTGMLVVGGIGSGRDNNYTLFNNRVTVNDITANCLGIATIGAGVLGESQLNRRVIAKLYNNVVNIEGGNFSMVTALLGAGVVQKNYELHDNVVAVNGGNFNFGILGGTAFYQLDNNHDDTGEPYNISGSMRENRLIVDNGEFRYVSLLMGGLGLGELLDISDNLVTINGGHFNNAFLCGIGTVKYDSSSPGVLQNNGVVISGGNFTYQEDGLSPEVWPYSFSAIFATLAATTNNMGTINYQRTDSFVKLENSSNALDLRNVYLAGNVDLVLDLDDIIQEEPGESPAIPDKLSKVAKSFTKKLRQEGQEDPDTADIIRQALDLESALRRWPANGSTSSLIVARSGVNALGVRLFDEIKFVLPADLASAPLVPMLTLNEALDLNFTDINYRSRVTRITLDTTTNATQFKRGDQLVLIEDMAGIQHFSAANIAGISSDFSVKLINNQLILQADKSHEGGGGGGGGSIDVNSLEASTKSVAASAVAVNNTLDVVASHVVNQMTSSTSTSNLFATSVSASKVITGSHVKTFGGSIVLGIARGFNHTMFGVFAEGGLSHFDCFETVKLDSGNSKFAGLGMVLKFDSKSTYLAASLHGGMLRTKTTFKTLTNYLGGFAELGWHLGSFVEAYSRYSYGRTGAIEELVQGTEVNIDPTESHRLRVGAKLMLDSGTFRPYLGFAYEREFKGETKSAIVDTQGSAAPTTSGNSGVIEFGTSCALSSSSFIHVNAQVAFGRRQGFGGGLTLEHRW